MGSSGPSRIATTFGYVTGLYCLTIERLFIVMDQQYVIVRYKNKKSKKDV